MSYAIVKDGEILCFSDKIPTKSVQGEYEEKLNEETEEMEKICIIEPIEGMIYDEAIKLKSDYDYTKNYSFVDGKIIVTEKEELTVKLPTKEELQQIIGKLVNQKLGMIELGEDTKDIETQIQSLKDEYGTL